MRKLMALVCVSVMAGGASAETKKEGQKTVDVDKDFDKIWDLPIKTLDGKPATLAAYNSKTLQVVN